MPVNLPPKADLFLDEVDSDAPDSSALGTLERSAIRCAGLGPRVMPAVVEANRTPIAFTDLFARAAMLMLLQRCEGTGKRSNSVLFASKNETLRPSDR